MDGSPPGSSVCGIFWARILEWVAISYCRWSFWPRDQPCLSCVSCIGNLGSQRHSYTCKSDQVSSKDLSLASHWLLVQDWAWQWLLQVALTCWRPPAGFLLSSRELAWNLLAPYHLTHLIIRIAILTFIGWDTISWFLLYLLCSLLPRKTCPLSSSTFLSPKDCLVTSYFSFRTSSNVSFCRTLSLRLLTPPGLKSLSFVYFCILFTLYIASDCSICLYSFISFIRPVSSWFVSISSVSRQILWYIMLLLWLSRFSHVQLCATP